MTLVNPPAFEERVKTYSSPKAAIQHLLNSRFSPEEIEWKIGIPYARALRVPKVVRFRHDKKVEEIGNIGKWQKLYELQYERSA